VQRLEGLDACFVSLESPTTPMHVAMTAVFDPNTAPRSYSTTEIRRLIEERLHLVPFRRRLVEVPARLHRPVWVEDPDFDLDRHLQWTRLREPGGLAELEAFTAEVICRPLDRSRPLWEMHVVEGLEDGMVAAVTKVHHSLIDGVSGAEITANLLDLTPERAPASPPAHPWVPERVPSPVALAAGAVRELVRQPFDAVAVASRAIPAALRVRRDNRRPGTTRPPGLFDAPRAGLSRPLTSRRHVAFAQVDLRDVEQVRSAAGVTVNDVVLTLCGTALRAHLHAQGESVDRSLVAAVPVSVRTDNQRRAVGNRLSGMLVDLATTVEDPLVRLRAVAESARAAKEQLRTLGFETVSDLTRLAPPALLAALGQLESRLHLLGRTPPLCNLIVSNFPGPALPLYCTGAQMLAAYPMGPLVPGVALNITVQSYLNTLWFGVVACPDVVPEPAALTDRLTDALHELIKASG
jgi:diacylglycerol O-acyltransferase